MSYDGPRFGFPTLTPAIKQLLLVNAAVFVANILLAGRLSFSQPADGGFWFAFSWDRLWEGYGLGLLRLVTYQFTHSFQEPMHLIGNMLVLYFFGTMAEQRLGYAGTWKLYLTGGIAGALLYLGIASLQGYQNVPLVGASGACYAFLVYAAFMAPRSMVIVIVFPLQLWILAAGLVGIGAYMTFVEFVTGFSDGTAHGAHLGGAALGALAFKANLFVDYGGYRAASAGWFGRLLHGLRQRRAAAAHKAAAEQELQLDEILAKVKQRGIGSLSPAERRFLERASQSRRGGS